MKILFALLHPGYLRHYESVVKNLAIEGHEIVLVFSQPSLLKQKEGELAKQLIREYPHQISLRSAPKRWGRWVPIVRLVRGFIDFLRYFDPRYECAVDLRSRVGLKTSSSFFALVRWFPFLRLPKVARRLLSLAHLAEYSIPTSREFDRFISDSEVNVVLVTPLINFASSQVDFIKSARRLKVPSALLVASWDNLTNKGLIRVQPDAVVVWNEAQRNEAVEMHGTLEQNVIITGAQSFDRWFEHKPSESYAEFTARVGLPPDRNFILYLCSSPYIGGDREVGFVEEWIRAVRANPHNPASQSSILIRPHPQNAVPWMDFDQSRFENVAVFPKSGANPITVSSKADFFNSMFHCAAVVGINTSSMIEAGIVGKPVLTVLAESFNGTQTGTLHFHHLVEHGLVQVAHDLDEHVDDLNRALSPDREWQERNREFIRSFVRPHGLEVPATPIVVSAILNLKYNPNLCRKPSYVLRGLLSIATIPAGVLACLRGTMRTIALKSIKMAWVFATWLLGLFGLKETVRTVIVPRLLSSIDAEGGITGKDDPNIGGLLAKEIKAAKEDAEWLIVGPWLSEVGFEVLYWIPFLRWASKREDWNPERVVVISRGGVSNWYEGIASHYLDVFEEINVEDYRAKIEKRWKTVGGQKQSFIDELDEELIQRAKKHFSMASFGVLHPHVMYNNFRDFWRGRLGINWMLKFVDLSPHANRPAPLPELPKSYFAVKFYFRPSFPDNEENRAFIEQVIESLTGVGEVVLLNTGIEFDDHPEMLPANNSRLHRIDHLMDAANNLNIQSRVIANARAFVGTYGGLSYLPLFYRVPSFTFFSNEGHFLPGHLDLSRRISREYGVPFLALATHQLCELSEMFSSSVTESPPSVQLTAS